MSPALCANYLFMSLKIHTPHSHTHTARTHHIYAESHQMHCILCGDPAANFSSTCAVPSLIPSCSYFLLPHIFLSLFYLAVASWELPALGLRLSLLGALFLVFSLQFDAFGCLLILVYLPSICIRSPTPPNHFSFQGQTQSVPNWPCNAVLFFQHFLLDSATVACLSFAAVTWAFCRIADEAGECRPPLKLP